MIIPISIFQAQQNHILYHPHFPELLSSSRMSSPTGTPPSYCYFTISKQSFMSVSNRYSECHCAEESTFTFLWAIPLYNLSWAWDDTTNTGNGRQSWWQWVSSSRQTFFVSIAFGVHRLVLRRLMQRMYMKSRSRRLPAEESQLLS